MKTALCIGGAAGFEEECCAAIELYRPDIVVACNDAGTMWTGELDAWVSLHPDKLPAWREQRRANRFPDAKRYFGHGDGIPSWVDLIEFRFPEQANSGSSGLFSAKVALIDLGADRAILAGIPLTTTPHFFDDVIWNDAQSFRPAWLSLDVQWRSRMRSMSGWTRQFLGQSFDDSLPQFTGEIAPQSPSKDEPMSKIVLDKIAYEQHPVSLERKRELNEQGYQVVDIQFKPADHEDEQPSASFAASALTDDELRAAIKEKTGKAPNGRAGRDTLLAQYGEAFAGLPDSEKALANKAKLDEVAASGLTRREILADLTALGVDHDEAESTESLGALRDVKRAEKDAADQSNQA